MTTSRTRLVVLLGHPVDHSRSPEMMTAAFAYHNIDAAYLACSVPPENLSTAIDGLWALGAVGANVTLPHKRAVLSLCERIDPTAAAVGAANTLVRTNRGFVACNTDAWGAASALTEAGVQMDGARVVILGAGGAARAVAVGVAMAGATEVVLVARNVTKAADIPDAVERIARHCRTLVVPWCDDVSVCRVFSTATVAVQATPLGMTGHPVTGDDQARMARWLGAMPCGSVAMDLVYQPRDTFWLRTARAYGLRSVDGLTMLAHQGALALQRWFDVRVTAAQLRQFLDERDGCEYSAPGQ